MFIEDLNTESNAAETVDHEYATANQAFYDQTIVSFVGV